MEPAFLEVQLSCMRHVMQHAVQFGHFLRRNGVGMDWVLKVRELTC